MEKKSITQDCKKVIYCIFEGLTSEEIAQKLNYSKSTVALRMRYLFKKYEVKNRIELIVTIFSQLIENYKKGLSENKKETKKLKQKIELIKTKIEELIKKNPKQKKILTELIKTL